MTQLIAAGGRREAGAARGDRPSRAARRGRARSKRFARASKLAVVTGASTAEATTRWRASASPTSSRCWSPPRTTRTASRRPSRTRRRSRAWASSAARSIAIEDATPGILSARAAGARVIAVRAGNFAGYDLSPADVVVDTLDDVTDELIARLLA